MDIFGDKKYDELDWLTKAVEPITYRLSDILVSLPQEYVLTLDDIKGFIGRYGPSMRIELDEMFVAMLRTHNMKINVVTDLRELSACYAVQMDSPTITIDLENNKLIGEIKIVKTKDRFTEEDLQKKMGQEGYAILGMIDEDQLDDKALSRINEVLELLGTKTHRHKAYGRLMAARDGYAEIMFQNKWKIRNVELSNKIAAWIRDYAIKGNLAAFTNFCKVKAITHRGYPIYSIEEEQ